MNQNRNVVLLIWMLMITPCFVGAGGNERDDIQRAYEQHKQQWGALALADYDYSVRRSCFCESDYTREMRIKVRSGRVVSADYTDNHQPVAKKIVADLKTINDWFVLINKELQRPAKVVEVEYNESSGNPQKIHIDIHPMIADDEQTILISNLQEIILAAP